jgi:hypothetical protein
VTRPLRPELCGWLGVLHPESKDILRIVSKTPPAQIPLNYYPVPYTEERVVGRVSAGNGITPYLLPTPKETIFRATVPYDFLLKEMSAPIELALKVTAEDLTAFLYALYAMVRDILRFPRLEDTGKKIEIQWAGESEEFRIETLRHWLDAADLGLLRSSQESWIHTLTDLARKVSEADGTVAELSESQVRAMLRRFMWAEGLPLKKNAPILFLNLSSRTMALDVFNLADFLRHVLLQANLIGRNDTVPKEQRIGDATGQWLEKQAFDFFTRNLELGPDSSWLNLRIKMETEIDIVFVYRRVLFVIDCKAMAKDAEFMEGQYKKLRNRQDEIRGQLAVKLPRRILLIQEGRGTPIDSSRYDRSVGLVCTSAVEYLPLSECAFWFHGIPVVGPPEELLDSINKLAQ